MKKEKEKYLLEGLKLVKKIFDKHKIVFWLDQGALLGLVREGKFIEWDTDIDLGTWQDIRFLWAELAENGFRIVSDGDRTLILCKEGCISLYLFHKEGRFGRTVWSRFNTKISHPIFYIHKRLMIMGESHRVPASIRVFLDKIVWFVFVKIGCKRFTIRVPLKYITKYKMSKFYGIEVRIPNDVEDYLDFWYIDDWRVPKKEHISYDGTVVLGK